LWRGDENPFSGYYSFVRFDEFELDEGRRELLRGGLPVHVSPKVLQLLQLLIDRAPNAVSKAEIYDRLWPSTFVSDVNIPSLVRELRTALGDDARKPRYVRTVHGFGYAFCVAPADAASSPEPVMGIMTHGQRDLPLHRGDNILVRDRSLRCSIDDRSVSRRHAAITCTDDRVTIRDLDSKNGTLVEGAPVRGEVELHDGDRVRLGGVDLTFRQSGVDRTTLSIGVPKDR
jgi:DNA-binding winged helix-turn-helix (wHTH) protein